jgi:hypothetical protein
MLAVDGVCAGQAEGVVWYLRTSEWHLSRHRNG